MSKENKFHNLIEKLDREEKDCAWEKIKAKENLRFAEEGSSTKKSVKRFAWRRLVAACAAVILVAVGIFAATRFLPQDKANTADNGGSSETPETSEDRYCDLGSYDMLVAEETFKEAGLLYLDWYDITDYCATSIFRLKESGETIGYCEEMVDVNTGSTVRISAIFSGYTLEDLEFYGDGPNSKSVGGVEIHWGNVMDYSYANFTYGAYEYFVAVHYPMAEDSVLDVIDELFMDLTA